MNKKKKLFIVLFVVGGVLGITTFGINYLKNNQTNDNIPKGAVMVETEKPHKETIVTKVNAKGKVQLIDKTVIYPQAQSRIKKINVSEGDSVTIGQILVQYDDKSLDELRKNLASAKLDLKAAQIGVQGAQLPVTNEEIFQKEIQVSQAKNSIADANSRIEQLDLEISLIEQNIEDKNDVYNANLNLYENGVIAKVELDKIEEQINELKNRLATTQAQRNSALVSLNTANQSLEIAQKQYNITANKNNNAVTQNNIDKQQVQVEQAQLKINQINNDIASFKYDEISTVNGTVLKVSAVEGDTLTTSNPIMEIGDVSINNLIMIVDVPENRSANLEVGQQVEIRGSAIGKNIIKGVVSKIYPQAEQKQVGNSMENVVVIEIKPTETKTTLRPGYSLETDIITKVEEDVMVIPFMSTLTDENGNNFVYVLKDDNTVQKRIVELGSYSGLYVQVSGVDENDSLIVNPPPGFNENSIAHTRPIFEGENIQQNNSDESEASTQSEQAS